jgi:uncharacterized protein (TIGR02996 family)
MSSHNPELEALIPKEPDDVDGYLVYGDWLEGQDPRCGILTDVGETIRTEVASCERID